MARTVRRAGLDPEDLPESFSDGAVIGALRALPKDLRRTLLPADVEQLDHAEVAAVLDVPVGRVHRGRSMVRDALLPGTQEAWAGRADYRTPSFRRAGKQAAAPTPAELAV